MKVIFYSNVFRKQWDDFVENSKNGTFMLKRAYMEYHSDRFTDFSLMFFNDENLIAIIPASLHGEQVRSHGGLTYGGIVCNTKMKTKLMLEVFDTLILFLRKQNISSLIYKRSPLIYHMYPSDEDLYALFKNDAKLVRRDISSTIYLPQPYRLSKGRKLQISRAKLEGVAIEESFEFKEFIELENSVLKRYHNAVAVHSAAEIAYLKKNFNDEIKLFVAKYNDKMIAACLLFIYKKLVHTQYLAADVVARELGGLDLLISTLINKYKNEKIYFDFGISTENDGKLLNEGLISQKEGFGGRGIVYDSYELII